MSNLEVGQKLWFVYNTYSYRRLERAEGSEVVVEKIGRNWAHLSDGHRINKESMVADGGKHSSPGRCYLSKEHYDAEIQLIRAWREFAQRVPMYGVPKGVTIEDIKAAAALLKLDGGKA